MSGWIKFEKALRDDPRVLRIARQLCNAGVTHQRFNKNALVTLVLGGLAQLWSYADTHIRDDDTLDLGIDEIDEVVGIQGFCQLLPSDWLQVIDADKVKLPDFLTHNGTEAKKKALTQKRVERHRESVTPERVSKKPSCNAPALTNALPDQDQTKTRLDQEKRVPSEPVELERSTSANSPLASKASEQAESVSRVFEHWRTVHRHSRAALDDKRRKIIREALKFYSEADLCQSISGYLNSPHHMGQNDRNTVYTDLELLLRDSGQIDAGLKFYAQPPRTDLSGKTRANVAAIADWKPPELRNAGK